MGKHRVSIGRRGVAMLAATGALVIGGTSAVMFGTGSAAPLDILPISSPATTTYVLPDLDPFTPADVRPPGSGEVSDEVGAPTGGGKAALRLSTPDGTAKASYAAEVSGADAKLENWIATAAYSAYQISADNPIQFPSLQLEVDPTGAGGFSTLTYEPVYNPGDSTTPGEWHRYQAGAGRWCSTKPIENVIAANQTRCDNGGDKPLADYVAGAQNLVVKKVIINQGSGNPGLESAVDLISTPTTTYDFELTEPTTPVDPTTPTTPPTTEPGNGGGNGGGNGNGHGNGGNNGGGHGNGPGHGNNGGGDGHCVCG